MIEHVCDLGSKLNVESFRNGYRFEKRQRYDLCTGSDHVALRCISETSDIIAGVRMNGA